MIAAVGKVVLVAEDDQAVRMLIRAVLQRDGYEVEEAVNGVEALIKLGERDYGAIVFDLTMPQLSGYDVLAAITERRRPARCVVIVSAAAPSEIARADPTIVRTVLQKPFDLADLRNAVAGCFDGSDWSM
jgi:CheY-like chemotaxis protein